MPSPYRRLKLSLTESCNLNCGHCYLGDKQGGHAPVDGIFKRIAEADALGVEILDLTGGEPTTHPKFVYIMDAAARGGFQRINISTNGVILSRPPILARLADTRFHCNISLDGASATTIDAIRGSGTHARLRRSLAAMQAAGIRFSLRFCINRINAGEVGAMVDWAVEMSASADFEPTQMAGNAGADLLLDRDTALETGRYLDMRTPDLPISLTHSLTVSIPCDGAQDDLLSMNAMGQAVSCLMIERDRGSRLQAQWDVPLAVAWGEALERKAKLAAFTLEEARCGGCNYLHLCRSGCWVTAHDQGCLTT
ncbi:radical SAM protein [Azospirillum sp. A26]|uniref:radical SAM protein n=1 Tax=Azospirillum sp. A26 TaxID=3160607 RepID=UPI00366B5367